MKPECYMDGVVPSFSHQSDGINAVIYIFNCIISLKSISLGIKFTPWRLSGFDAPEKRTLYTMYRYSKKPSRDIFVRVAVCQLKPIVK